MIKSVLKTVTLALLLGNSTPLFAQFDNRLFQGAMKALQAITLTDGQMKEYVREYVVWMDKSNPVCDENDPYTLRLRKLTRGLTQVEGTALNFKVYRVGDINAFACADGSVRVFSALMDIMSDDELLGVIGHEIGHVAHKDSKDAFRTALLTSALKDGVASQGGRIAQLTDSQLGNLGEALINSSYSRKQENEADDYGYSFLKRHGKNPWAMALSLRKLRQLEGEQGIRRNSRLNQLFSSHPDLEARIKRMENKARAEGIVPPAIKYNQLKKK